jgi:ATP-dependent Clp protease ATP-binding subunit ClpC
MTSNIGARDIKNIGSYGFGSEKPEDKYSTLKNTVEEAMRKLFNPEFLNRIDETIVFRNLDREDIIKIIDIEIKDLLKNIHDNKMEFFDDSAKFRLRFDPKFGARPLRRAIQKYLEDPLAEEILRGTFKEGAKIVAKHFENMDEVTFIEEGSIDIPDKEKEKTDTSEA